MMQSLLVVQHADNAVVWAILALALLCFSVLLDLLLAPRDALWQSRVQGWLRILPVLISALPLLGLLGTIAGLLDTFDDLALGGTDRQTLLGGGIADALATTQLGLVTAVTALVLLALLRRRQRELRA